MARSRRLQLAHEIAARVHAHYGDAVLAIGVYGSVARGTDGPYSDIEMHCVVRGSGIDRCLEWSTGPWKAEVDVYSEDALLAWAAALEGDWPLTHGSFVEVHVVYDPGGLFARLRDAALSHPAGAFERTIHDVIVGEVYELVGKVRNARAAGNEVCMPYLAVELAKMGACLIGLANRHLYTTTTRAWEESLAQPGRPQGYDRLCRMVMAGDLADADRIADAAEGFWAGVGAWATDRGMPLVEDLETLLEQRPLPE